MVKTTFGFSHKDFFAYESFAVLLINTLRYHKMRVDFGKVYYLTYKKSTYCQECVNILGV